jgi:23S rRNA pseudouridine1911/1915/1917 synthase
VPPRHALPEGTVPAVSTDAVPLVDDRPTLREVLDARGIPAAEQRTALETGKIWVRDAPTAMGGRQVDAEDVTVRMDAPRSIVGRDVVFVYADAHLAIVSKPSGMLAVPAPGRRGETSVISAVSKRYGKALPVHRLDEQTSGLMIVALTDEARAALIDDVSEHRIERIYLAIAAGKPNFDSRRVETLIARDRGDGLRGTVRHDDPDAMRAVTHLKVLERYERASLIEAQLETGRTHQIRIHLSELRLPLLGDPLYAPVAIRGLAPRLALHSARLGLTHPITGRRLQFYTDLPDDLERVRLRLAKEVDARPKPPRAPKPPRST